MTLTIIIDTETTGIPARNEIVTSPSYPHLVEIAGLLLADGKECSSFNFIVKPEGWVIPEEVAKVHGIFQELALARGVPLALAIAAYVNLRALADEIVGHNVAFDLGIVAAAIHRLGRVPSHPGPSKVSCTSDLGTSLVQLPPTEKMVAAGYGPYKRPNLGELYQFLFGEELVNAHTALADCRAIARCLNEIRKRELIS